MVFTSLSVCWWGSITILLLQVHFIRTVSTVTIHVLVVLANTLQYHDTVDFVQDPETEDPQRLQEAERRTRDTAGERADRPVNPAGSGSADPANSSSASSSDATAGSDAANAGTVVAGGVAQDTAQDAEMSGAADGRTNEERAKRQRTEKKTELDVEVSNVAKIIESRRILDLRRDGWKPENVNNRNAATFCACEL